MNILTKLKFISCIILTFFMSQLTTAAEVKIAQFGATPLKSIQIKNQLCIQKELITTLILVSLSSVHLEKVQYMK